MHARSSIVIIINIIINTTLCYDTNSASMSRHCALSDAIDSRSWSNPASLASHSTASLHRVRHLSLLRFAFSGLHCDRALGSLSWPIRLTWPNHFNLLVLRSKDAGVWPVLYLTVVFLTWCNHFIPRIRRRHRLSKPSSLLSSLIGVAHVSDP